MYKIHWVDTIVHHLFSLFVSHQTFGLRILGENLNVSTRKKNLFLDVLDERNAHTKEAPTMYLTRRSRAHFDNLMINYSQSIQVEHFQLILSQ